MVGVATTDEPVVVLTDPAGLQVYVSAPVAVKVLLIPLHTLLGLAVTVKLGNGFTFNVIV